MSEYISGNLKQQIYSYFANCCAYCHTAQALMPITFECEHIIPRSAGGKTVFENLCLACRWETYAFLKQEKAYLPYTEDDLD